MSLSKYEKMMKREVSKSPYPTSNVLRTLKYLMQVLLTYTDSELPSSIPQYPRGDPGVKSRMCPPYPQRVVKGD